MIGCIGAFINLALFILVEPILSDWFQELGLEAEWIGNYFFIYPFTYSITSIMVDKFALSFMHKRVCIIVGYLFYAVGFIISGPVISLIP